MFLSFPTFNFLSIPCLTPAFSNNTRSALCYLLGKYFLFLLMSPSSLLITQTWTQLLLHWPLNQCPPIPSPSMLSVSLRPIHFERQLFGCWNRWDNEAIQQSGIITFPLQRCLVAVACRGATGTETGQPGWKMAGSCPWLDRIYRCKCSEKNITVYC